MDEHKRQLKGSASLDAVKHWHKSGNSSFYASDVDLVLVHKAPAGIVGVIDYKDPQTGDQQVTFAAAITYNVFIQFGIPVFIVKVTPPFNDVFTIIEYLGGDWRPNPPNCNLRILRESVSAKDFWQWETNLRSGYKNRIIIPTTIKTPNGLSIPAVHYVGERTRELERENQMIKAKNESLSLEVVRLKQFRSSVSQRAAEFESSLRRLQSDILSPLADKEPSAGERSNGSVKESKETKHA